MSQLLAPGSAGLPVPVGQDESLFYAGVLPQGGTESAILRYWRIFQKHRWVVVSAIGACLSFSLITTLLTRPQYTAVTRIQVARAAPKVVSMDQPDDNNEPGIFAGMEFYQTQYALLKSRSLAEAVARDLVLTNNSSFLKNHGASRIEKTVLPSQKLSLASAIINQNTTITPVRESSIIDIRYRDPDPNLAARVANSISKNFIESNLSRRFESASYAREFLQRKLDQTRAKLEDSERKAVAYAQREGLIQVETGTGDSASQRSLLSYQLTDLSTQLSAARGVRIQAEAQFRSGAGGAAAAQSLNSSTVNAVRSQRAELLGQLSKLQSDFGPEYPPVVALRSQIAELDRQLVREQSNVSSSVSQDLSGKFREAATTERQLQSKVDALKAQLLGEQGRSIQYNILKRDVDTNRTLYEALLQRFKEVGIAGGVGTNNVSIVDRALTPTSPSSPNLLFNLALGLLFGLFAGGIAALVLEQLSESVISPAEFQSKLRVPLLGSTPKSEVLNKPLVRLGSAPVRQANSSLVELQPELAEAYFSILTAIQFSTSEGAPRIICITSSQPREGKSTSAMAIAKSLAGTGSRVLLVDADLRNPSLHRAYNLSREKGLSDVLTSQADLGDVMNSTNTERLTVLTAGRAPPNPAELLGGQGLLRLIKTASEIFDHVIFDSPPVLGLADAPLISSVSDGTIYIIEAGKTRASDARQGLDRLIAVRSHILGAVLTKLDSSKSGYGYGYGYTYRYGATG